MARRSEGQLARKTWLVCSRQGQRRRLGDGEKCGISEDRKRKLLQLAGGRKGGTGR